MDRFRPSRVALPALLRRRFEVLHPSTQQHPPNNNSRSCSEYGNDQHTALLQTTARALQSIQTQIAAGEECYAEESNAHNLFKGWDGFIDARADVLTGSNGSGLGGGGGGHDPPRRLPADHRWCSGSCPADVRKDHQPMGHYVPETEFPPPTKQVKPKMMQQNSTKTLPSSVTPAKRKEPTPAAPEAEAKEKAEKREETKDTDNSMDVDTAVIGVGDDDNKNEEEEEDNDEAVEDEKEKAKPKKKAKKKGPPPRGEPIGNRRPKRQRKSIT